MKIHVKKLVCIMVACFLLFLMVACAQKTSNNVPNSKPGSAKDAKTTGLYTIKLLSAPTTIKNSVETEVGKIIKDKFNIVLEYIPYTGDLREKQNLMLAAGDYPELMDVQREDIVMKYIQAGALLPLDGYLADNPNFVARYKDVIPYWRLPAADGKLYKWEQGVPQDFSLSMEVLDIGIRTDMLEKQGWPKLVSEDDYIKFLKKALQDMPKNNGQKTLGMTVPFAEPWGLQGIAGIMYEKGGIYSTAGGNEGVIWNQIDQKYVDYMKNEYVKESLHFFNRLYREGILDKECFTDFLPQVQEKLRSGNALSVWYTTWEMSAANLQLQKAGHPEMQYINMPIRSNTQFQKNDKRQVRTETTRPFNSVVITKNAKDPKRIMQLVDWAATEEGSMLLQGGIEGKHYKIENGKRVPIDANVKLMLSDAVYAAKQGVGSFGIIGGWVPIKAKDGQPYNLGLDPAFKDKINLTDRQKEAYQKMGWADSTEYWKKTSVGAPSGLSSSIMIDPNTDLGNIHAKMVEFRVKNSAKLIMAKDEADFEKIYASVLSEYEKLNPNRVVDKYNELLKENQVKLQGLQKK